MQKAISSRILEITTNVGCRLMCLYCPQAKFIQAYKINNSLKEFGVLTRKKLNQYLDTVPTSVDIHFSGYSEPFHSSDCIDMIKDVDKRGHKLAVFTTGDGLDIDRITEISHIDFKKFMLHVPDRHGLLKLKVNSEYIKKINILQQIFKNKIDIYSLGEPHSLLTKEFSEIITSDRVTSRADNLQKEANKKLQNYLLIRSIDTRSKQPIICRRHRILSNVLLPNGDIQLCCMDYGLKEKLGSLLNQSYTKIVNGHKFIDVINRMNNPKRKVLCDSCEYAQPGSYTIY